jgi:hypothetical protein
MGGLEGSCHMRGVDFGGSGLIKKGSLWWGWPNKRGGLWWEWPNKKGGLLVGVA